MRCAGPIPMEGVTLGSNILYVVHRGQASAPQNDTNFGIGTPEQVILALAAGLQDARDKSTARDFKVGSARNAAF